MCNGKTFDLFLASNDTSKEPNTSIDYLSETYGEDIFQRLLNNLLNREYSSTEAISLWNKAMRHMTHQNNRINWRSVILDYLLSQSALNNPRIIEADELRRLQQSTITDSLTDLHNQSFFKQQLAQKTRDARQETDASFSLLLLELDHFQQFTARKGHQQGDKALKQAAQLIADNLPEDSIVARYSGAQFAAILPQADQQQAIDVAETIRAAIEKEPFTGEELLDAGCLTISCGIAFFPASGTDSNKLFDQANSKLRLAQLNRNKVVPGKRDTRHATRHCVRNIVEIFDSNSGHFKNALSADLSPKGILLSSSTPAIIGCKLKIRFPYPFWPNDHYASGQVRHIRRSGSKGGFLLGIEFSQPQVEFVGEILPAAEETVGL